MKRIITVLALSACLVACQQPAPGAGAGAGAVKAKAMTKDSLSTEEAKLNYTIGRSIGQTLKRTGVPMEEAVLAAGIRASYNEEPSLLTDEEMQQVQRAHSMKVQAKRTEEMQSASAGNKVVGDKFLAENKAKEGVVVTESGLQYKVLTEGKGKKPTAEDTVSVNYRGKLIDGTEFDSSFKRNAPATFQVGRVIKGWTEALQLMPVGSKWELVIPADIAYGDRGAGALIKPGSVLIFEVELLEIQAPKAAAAPKKAK
jgi:FKBP-type peptidyl-prolyl cis-trans isomerase FkpA